MTTIKMVCVGCKRNPDGIDEYLHAAQDAGMTASAYVRLEEGTYNQENGHFLCTDCYVRAGCPSTPNGWVAP